MRVSCGREEMIERGAKGRRSSAAASNRVMTIAVRGVDRPEIASAGGRVQDQGDGGEQIRASRLARKARASSFPRWRNVSPFRFFPGRRAGKDEPIQ